MHGIVKSVLSGDSVIVMGADASKGPPPEKLLTLSGIVAPRLGNRGGTPDQPFAWGSREFLRQQAIGKRVTFQVDGQNASNREFGSIFLEDGTSLAALTVGSGCDDPHCLKRRPMPFWRGQQKRAAWGAWRGVVGADRARGRSWA